MASARGRSRYSIEASTTSNGWGRERRIGVSFTVKILWAGMIATVGSRTTSGGCADTPADARGGGGLVTDTYLRVRGTTIFLEHRAPCRYSTDRWAPYRAEYPTCVGAAVPHPTTGQPIPNRESPTPTPRCWRAPRRRRSRCRAPTRRRRAAARRSSRAARRCRRRSRRRGRGARLGQHQLRPDPGRRVSVLIHSLVGSVATRACSAKPRSGESWSDRWRPKGDTRGAHPSPLCVAFDVQRHKSLPIKLFRCGRLRGHRRHSSPLLALRAPVRTLLTGSDMSLRRGHAPRRA